MTTNNNNNNNDCSQLYLNNKTQLQLSIIASSYGISASKLNREEIIEKIESIVKRKQKFVTKKEIDINLNSFNKEIQLLIKEGIDPLEWLFWKIFRNKIIYKNIFSFLYSNLSKSYDSIVCVNWLLVNGKISILKDKVNRNKYLRFQAYDSNPTISINLLFSTIRKNENENIKFYQNLFTNYNQNLQYFNNQGNLLNTEQELVSPEFGQRELLNLLITRKCLPAIQVLVETYNYKPTFLDLYKSIEIGSIKILKYFLQSRFNIQVDESLIFKSPNCRNLKSLIHLYKSGLLGSEFTLDQFISKYIKQTISRDDFLINNNNVFLKSNTDTTLKSLVTICNLILKSTTHHKTSQKDLLEIKTFLSFLSKDQLNSKLQDITNHQDVSSKRIIKKLFEFYYQVSGFDKHLFYLILFEKDDHYITSEMVKKQNHNIDKYIILAFKCGNFSLLLNWYKINDIASRKGIIENIFISEFSNLNHSLLFTHCNSDDGYGWNEKIKFTNQIIQHIKSETKLAYSNNIIFGPLLFFYLVISTDDMKLIEYVSGELKEEIELEFRNRKKSIPNIITRYIKSISTLDYLYCNVQYFKHFELTKQCSKWFYFNNVQLLQHFQKLHFNHSPPIFEHSIDTLWVSHSNNSCNEIVDYIIFNGLSVFPIKQVSLFNYVDTYYTSNSKPFTRLQQFKKLSQMYLRAQPNIYFTSKLFSICKSFDFIIFIDWLFRNCNSGNQPQLRIGGPYIKNEESLCFAYYKTNRYDLLAKQLGRNNFEAIATILIDCTCDDLNVVDVILNHFTPNGGTKQITSQDLLEKISRFIYYDVLLKSSKYGSLPTFEFIFQNYPIVLRKITQPSSTTTNNNNNNGGYFTLRQLKDLLVYSLKFDHIDQSKFLFDLYQLTKSEFQNVASQLSFIRFKDKVFK